MKQLRKCGIKPQHPSERAKRVENAIRELERIGAAFTIAEIAEKAGISRATIYRSPDLRSLIGTKGDNLRPIAPEDHQLLTKKHQLLKKKTQEIRRQLAEAEEGWDEMRQRALAAERKLQILEQQVALLQARLSHQEKNRKTEVLTKVASQLSREALRKGRREIARALHPDLFAKDSAAAELATELLKTLNSIID